MIRGIKINKIRIGLVVPVHNESENIQALLKEIREFSNKQKIYDYRVVVVDDGSTDDTLEKVLITSKKFKNLKIIRLAKRFGQTTALRCGIESILDSVHVIVTMDGDGQDSPNEIVKIIEPVISENYDLSVGWRKDRNDSWIKKKLSRVANNIIKWIFNIPINDQGSPLKAFTPDLYRSIPKMYDMHRYIPLLAGIVGARICEVPVMHRPRVFGKSKYGAIKAIKVALDIPFILISTSFIGKLPRVIMSAGLIGLIISLTILIYILLDKIFNQNEVLTNVLFYLSLNLILFSVIVMLISITISNKADDKLIMFKDINL